MQAGTRTQFNRTLLAQRVQFALVVQRETERIDGALEQHEQAVGAIDQLAIPAVLQHQHQAVVFLEQARAATSPIRSTSCSESHRSVNSRARSWGYAGLTFRCRHSSPASPYGPSGASTQRRQLPPSRLAWYSARSALAYHSLQPASGASRLAPMLTRLTCGVP